ncbi:hypothetical protein [Endozoicomonas sp. ONNA1]|uniref:hypothetical protein n=2 Tax=unclassified Endozoicomonas TaxID=2644528 RepID=UPI0021475DF4|nr:hypothetical protein [Endozoicomonas sp. ONNA1]
MIKHLLSATLLLLLILLPVTNKAQSLTRHFVVEFEQKTDSPNQSFSIKRDRYTLPDNQSDIDGTNVDPGSDSPPDDQPHRLSGCGVKTTIIKSIAWPWFYTTHLLAGCEPILIKNAALSSSLYSRTPVEVFVAVGWLLRSYWSPDSPLFKPMEQQEARPVLTPGDHSFVTIITMSGYRQDQPQARALEPSGQRAPGAAEPAGYFISLFYSDSGGGNGGPQKPLHTLDLNCFVFPCYGICRFRLSPDCRQLTEWSLNSADSSTVHTETTPGRSSCPHSANGRCLRCLGYVDPVNTTYSQHSSSTVYGCTTETSESFYLPELLEEIGISFTFPQSTPPVVTSETGQTTTESSQLGQTQSHLSRADTAQALITHETAELTKTPCRRTLSHHKRNVGDRTRTCNVIIAGKDGQLWPCRKTCKNTQALGDHKRNAHSKPLTCDETVFGEDGQLRPCGKVLKNVNVLRNHKKRDHTGPQTCGVITLGKDGQMRPCGMFSKNAHALKDHTRRAHIRQTTCTVSVLGEDGQQRPCGKACPGTIALSDHKRKEHCGKQTCVMSVVGKDDQPRPCGKVCKNRKALASHKSRYHTGRKTCNKTVVGEDGHQRACGKVCENARALADHRSKTHTGPKACDKKVVGEDGKLRPCVKVCKDAKSLSDHKSKFHSSQKACDVTVVREDGQQQPCGKVCKNVQALSNHKKVHQKPKPVDLDRNDAPGL